MPIMPSTTYHKYDGKYYKDIDPEYGTLEDFDEFVAACYETEGEVDLSEVSLNGNVAEEVAEAGMLQTGEEAPSLDGSKVTLPAYSVELVR